MIVHDEKEMLYLHLPKTAGWYVARHLVERCGFRVRYATHSGLDCLSETERKYTKIATIRNPLSWYISQYFYKKNSSKYAKSGDLTEFFSCLLDLDFSSGCDEDRLRKWFLDDTRTWRKDDFAIFEVLKDKPNDFGWYTARFIRQCCYNWKDILANFEREHVIRNFRMSMEPDLVVRVEHLDQEFNRLIADAGLPLRHLVKRNKENCSNHSFFLTYYDENLLKKVMHKDRVIFDLFYRSDGPGLDSIQENVKSDCVMLNKLGEVLYEGGRITLAQDVFREVLRRDPEVSTPYNNLGVISWQLGSSHDALELFKRALEVDPGNEEAIANCVKIAGGNSSVGGI